MNENEQPEVEAADEHDHEANISATEMAPKFDEKDRRILELEHMVMLQSNTITAFSNRCHELEMRIVELMSQAEYDRAVRGPLPETPGPPPIHGEHSA
jgi:hypothetical protein